MPASRLYRKQDPAGSTKYQDLKQLAQTQTRVLAGTPGTLKQRTQSGRQYWVREYIRVDGKKTDEYIGAVDSVDQDRIARWESEIAIAKSLASGSASLRLFGYQRIERKPAAVLEVFFNRGLIQGGLTLVGSHAYGALLNELGVIAPGYATHDIDVARAQAMAIALGRDVSFGNLLNESGLTFVPVPGMPSRRPSASFKLPGAELLAVDLLVPGRKLGELVPVKELSTYAQAIPLLDFLVHEPVDSVALSPNQVIPVKVPAPERFVIHKLFSSQSRKADRSKVAKDLDQAAVLTAALEDQTPGSLRALWRRVPSAGKSAARRGAAAAAKRLQAYPQAQKVLLDIASA
jgi:hypothetical protein